MTPGELAAWTAGYLAGWERGQDPENLVWYDRADEVRAAMKRSEQAGRRREWDLAVLRGERPDGGIDYAP